MDLKYLQDEADLSVGLSVTCSTAADGLPVPQQPLPSMSSLYPMQYTTQHFPQYDSEPLSYPSDISVNYTILNSANQMYEFEQDAKNIITLDSCKVKEPEHQGENNVPYGSPARVQTEAHKMQVCKACGKTFKFQTSLLRHNNKVHISRYQCSACYRVFSRQSYLDVHTSKPGTSCFLEQKVKSKRRR
uniref:C2H2-type domain-containing protein n=1 Tax=Graphocephala atropunctata TaxID=36148 RepID=A0A1B6LUY4_9HEMI